MKTLLNRCPGLLRVALLTAVCGASALPAKATVTLPNPITLSNAYVGMYEALANLTIEAFQKGDMDRAVLQGKLLETAWDRSESVMKAKNRDTWGEIDDAMDDFIRPITQYADQKPDPAAVEKAYLTFIEKLKLARRS